MARISYITPEFAVAPQLTHEEFGALGAMGFRAIISNRPDNEDGLTLPATQAASLARQTGLVFHHVPARMDEVLDDAIVDAFAEALGKVRGPVVAYCKSGTRAAILWALASVRAKPVECVLKALLDAGYDLGFLKEDLEAQAARHIGRSEDIEALLALDCADDRQLGVAA